ncbi:MULTISPECIES: apolipoprotein N-acyltransferase [unclassified Streptomyces]|uniref:apolipoprotein N-acyltransferase n=1 Tax=unclassified Streptomyces TaxID=2593676 RepID=UPI00081EF889|nr:apolipoprotein N-acyltransferase [Streptomyces sp. LcepLS]MYR28571.1 apolipoprotein N-acyltransferase [Streptomyces sp. SID4945]SCF39117.1 apolipoprotein N-acyltransferase [Streptomyces sp. LcepLS]
MTVTLSPPDEASPPAPASRGGRRLLRLVPAAGAVLAGVLLYLSFPPRTVWWLALPAFALLAWVLHGRSWKAGLGLGYLFGLGYFLPLLVWTGVEVGSGPWLALAAAEAVFGALVGAGIAVVSRLPAAPLWAAALWTAGEAARARVPFGGFPWGKVAFGQADGVFLPLAALGGTPVLGFAVVLCGFGLYAAGRALYERRARGMLPRAAALTAGLAVLLPLAGALASRALVSDEAEAGTARVAVIQGNVPRAGLEFNAQRRAVLDYHVKETKRLAERVDRGEAKRPDFVLWPENSSDIDPFRNPDASAAIDSAAQAIKAPISVGAVVEKDDGKLYNEQVLWLPGKGPTATYDKRQIQPFGEYLPMRSLLHRINDSWTTMVAQDFSRGTAPGVFTIDGTRVGIATCYEAAFDWAVRDTVTHGAELISVPSNNATFDRSEMTYQQLAMSRVRAVEHSRSVTVPVTSGVSAVIRPDGEIVQRTGMFVPATLVDDVPLRTSETPATRMGIAPETALVVVAAGGLAWAITRGVRGRRAA